MKVTVKVSPYQKRYKSGKVAIVGPTTRNIDVDTKAVEGKKQISIEDAVTLMQHHKEWIKNYSRWLANKWGQPRMAEDIAQEIRAGMVTAVPLANKRKSQQGWFDELFRHGKRAAKLFIYRNASMMPVKNTAQNMVKVTRIQTVSRRLEQELHREPSDEEISIEAQLPIEDIEALRKPDVMSVEDADLTGRLATQDRYFEGEEKQALDFLDIGIKRMLSPEDYRIYMHGLTNQGSFSGYREESKEIAMPPEEKRVFDVYKQGLSIRGIARALDMPLSSAYRAVQNIKRRTVRAAKLPKELKSVYQLYRQGQSAESIGKALKLSPRETSRQMAKLREAMHTPSEADLQRKYKEIWKKVRASAFVDNWWKEYGIHFTEKGVEANRTAAFLEVITEIFFMGD